MDPTINQAIATASKGDYLNSEDDASLLSNFFVQVLQNSIKYSTVETMRVISDKTRFSSGRFSRRRDRSRPPPRASHSVSCGTRTSATYGSR